MLKQEIGKLQNHQLIDSGGGMRLEKFGDFTLARPDPGALWKKSQPESEWALADAVYIKRGDTKGKWKMNSKVPAKWLMSYEFNLGNSELSQSISFYAKLTPFKHTGVFPEQSANWDFIVKRIARSAVEDMKVLNLFGYTGIASVLCAKLGCEVTHVDSSRPAVSWAKENMLASGLPENSIRWIIDDIYKFVKREAKRGNKYNAVIMDPPAFGRGPKGELWKFNSGMPILLDVLKEICATGDELRFVIINAYAVSLPSLLLNNLLQDLSDYLELEAETDHGELVLQERSGRLLSTGMFGRLYQ